MTAVVINSSKMVGGYVDKFDLAIIEQLKLNARASVSSIADNVSLAFQLQFLLQTAFHLLLTESQKEGVSVYFEVQHQCARCSEVIHHFRSIPEVITCHGITGDMDLLVFVKAETMRRIHEIREQLDALENIVKIKTHVVMSEWL